ncbi:hypothetical protein G4V39_00470 [Thermosulfuriphilus ammonigenes]|uniref:Uncharacterized protein n=1 Tax=Thermosulfuriphilus ammonigenes TaxID=1936021 RepID=A0A6G7PT57_9BACT|nr:hypothetical protein [Thermosulfuriphilus ammonigenes]MBA2849217.1 hypothetical protein [Thermosulfuriphilus ammonigenes]QIJ70832.1 hypothetical protein G4V39_00470 [Thermosulfuriphilus ammonigenes]
MKSEKLLRPLDDSFYVIDQYHRGLEFLSPLRCFQGGIFLIIFGAWKNPGGGSNGTN